MTWSAPSAFAFSALASSPTVVMTVQPMAFAILIATEPMPEPAACTRMVSPGLSLALSNSMCSVVPKAIGEQAAREAVNVEAEHAGDVFAEIVAALAAIDAMPAGHGAVHHDLLVGQGVT